MAMPILVENHKGGLAAGPQHPGARARASVGCLNLTAWCSGPRGCASTRDVLLLDAVQLCASVLARSTVRRDGDEVRVEDG
ncbi:unnamed protein product [Prunus armeniaca]